MIWVKSHRADPFGRVIADRHYNRQKVGSPQFVPPGRCLVLLAPSREDAKALWVTSWPRYAQHAWEGAWINSTFRNEGAGLSSELIRDALACTRYRWGGEEPGLGMITFIAPESVRDKKDIGYCYLKAGFIRVGKTKINKRIVFQIKTEDMPPAEPWRGEHQQSFPFMR